MGWRSGPPPKGQAAATRGRTSDLHHDLIEAVPTKSPADRTLFHGQLVVVPVPSLEKLEIVSIPSRTQRDEAERRAPVCQGLVGAVSTKSPADRTYFRGQLTVVPVLSRDKLAVGSIPSRTQRDEEKTVPSLIMTSSTPLQQSRQLIEPY